MHDSIAMGPPADSCSVSESGCESAMDMQQLIALVQQLTDRVSELENEIAEHNSGKLGCFCIYGVNTCRIIIIIV